MPVQQKRFSAAPHAGRGSRADTTFEKCNAIGNMLQSAQGYPRDVLDMLANSAHSCLTTPMEKRHEFQNNIINMIGEVLESVEASCALKAVGLKTKLAHADSEKCTREANLRNSIAQLEACKEFLEAAQKALKEAEAARKTAEKSVRDLGPEMKKVAHDAHLADAEILTCRGLMRNFRQFEGGHLHSSPPTSPKSTSPKSVMEEASPTAASPAAISAEAASAGQSPLGAAEEEVSPTQATVPTGSAASTIAWAAAAAAASEPTTPIRTDAAKLAATRAAGARFPAEEVRALTATSESVVSVAELVAGSAGAAEGETIGELGAAAELAAESADGIAASGAVEAA